MGLRRRGHILLGITTDGGEAAAGGVPVLRFADCVIDEPLDVQPHGVEGVGVQINHVTRGIVVELRFRCCAGSSIMWLRSYSVPKNGVAMSYQPLSDSTLR